MKSTPVRGLLPLVVLLGLWQLFGDPESPYFPPPSEWVSAVQPLVDNSTLWDAIGATALTFLLGLVLATVIGSAVGTVVGASKPVDRALSPSLEFLRALPAASLVPVAALILGYTTSMKLVVVVLPATWPILLACRTARRSLSPVLLDVPKTLGLSRWERVTKILTPALLPAVLLGVRVAAPLALIITLLVEIITRVDGLGAVLGAAQANFLSAQVYGLLVVTGVLGYVVNWIVTRGETAISGRMRPN
ncbi:ABC transporter permease subunit [Kibdelosporangium philippinense]|uniref:ABC transporter permease subunit n=1 Tax=Kibdelosporangium philippinense TaxID=211113 RepID=A0ABS8ZT32_9PSEU|nr:ABC transporter permease subunit [Kibdelosporangium philippinense]MCE7010890.1 ABC transporter permease subunit [Kibdelosporangium philippinense]